MGIAPIGYANKITEDGKKYIAPKQPSADIMKWVFETINEEQLNVEQIMKLAFKKGLRCSKATFWNLLRNPVYCGRMYIGAYKNEPATHLRGTHEAIISEALFYDVQDLLDGKKKKYRTKVGSQDELQLRGYLICPRCGRLLTGSASTGRTRKHYYYHCSSTCGTRFNALEANRLFLAELYQYQLRPGMHEIYKKVILQEFNGKFRDQRQDVNMVKNDLEKTNSELAKARQLLLGGEIEPSEYRLIKNKYEERINGLESKLFEFSKESLSIEPVLDKALHALSNLGVFYQQSDNTNKRMIVGSMFPEKITFDGTAYRTTRLNEAVALIYTLGAGFSQNKNGQTDEKIDLSSCVTRPGFEPRQAEPESAVLPLYYRAINAATKLIKKPKLTPQLCCPT